MAVPVVEAGLERMACAAVAGDRGYGSEPFRSWLVARGIDAVIPRRRHARAADDHDVARSTERNRVERLFNRLKRFRAVATRYDKLLVSYHAMITIACILEWL